MFLSDGVLRIARNTVGTYQTRRITIRTHPELRRFRRTTTAIVGQLQFGVDTRWRLTVLAPLGPFLDDCVALTIDHLIEDYSRLFGPMNLWLLGQLASYQVDRAARIT